MEVRVGDGLNNSNYNNNNIEKETEVYHKFTSNNSKLDIDRKENEEEKEMFTMQFIKKYIMYAKRLIHPILTQGNMSYILRFQFHFEQHI